MGLLLVRGWFERRGASYPRGREAIITRAGDFAPRSENSLERVRARGAPAGGAGAALALTNRLREDGEAWREDARRELQPLLAPRASGERLPGRVELRRAAAGRGERLRVERGGAQQARVRRSERRRGLETIDSLQRRRRVAAQEGVDRGDERGRRLARRGGRRGCRPLRRARLGGVALRHGALPGPRVGGAHRLDGGGDVAAQRGEPRLEVLQLLPPLVVGGRMRLRAHLLQLGAQRAGHEAAAAQGPARLRRARRARLRLELCDERQGGARLLLDAAGELVHLREQLLAALLARVQVGALLALRDLALPLLLAPGVEGATAGAGALPGDAELVVREVVVSRRGLRLGADGALEGLPRLVVATGGQQRDAGRVIVVRGGARGQGSERAERRRRDRRHDRRAQRAADDAHRQPTVAK